MDWSIITLTIPERAAQFESLRQELARQISGRDGIEHVVVSGDGTIGEKVRQGYERSRGRYVSVVDDDDWVTQDYVNLLQPGPDERSDVITFGYVIHGSELYWLRSNVVDEVGSGIRAANHLCLWDRRLALSSPCLPRNYAWDYVWYTCLNKGRLGLVERHVPSALYEYRYDPQGTRAQDAESIDSSLRDGGNNIICCKHRTTGVLMAGKRWDCLQHPDGTVEDFTGRWSELQLLENVWFR